MNEKDLPWAGEEYSTLFQLAAFAKDTAHADGVISVFIRGPLAKLGWCLPPGLYPKMPMILSSASEDAFSALEWVISDPGVQLPGNIRREIELLIQVWRGTKFGTEH